jgi:hypothetical protein
MSREAGRLRALQNAARLEWLLQSRERLELLGLAIVPLAPEPPTRPSAPRVPESRPH